LLNNLSYAFCGIGEYDKAKKIIDKVLTLRPKYRQGYLTLANIYENLGNLKAASEALVKAKALSAETSYIDKGISQLKKDISLSDKKGLLPLDTIYLKNGRRIEGRIIEEDGEKVILEVDMGETIGNLIFYRKAIKEISKCIRR
jgi:tetratricopeptide (TPR) repeat protein